MNYSKQVKEISNYFRYSETNEENFKIGVEFEHFVIDQVSFDTISYYGEHGVCDTLKKLESIGYEGIYESNHLLGLTKGDINVSLEPGSQLEVSINAKKEIRDIETEYKQFLKDISPILDAKNQCLIACGYQPKTPISEIKMIPKPRYDYMFHYFKSCGKYAHNMMKGTASVQYSFDFKSEDDYKKKFKVLNALSPVFYAMFDNSPFFESKEWSQFSVRTDIWRNCDIDRCGIVDHALESNFSYDQYSKYILERSPIYVMNNKCIHDVKEQLFKDLFDPDDYKLEDLEHVLTMVFPDVRTKRFVEIRMIDAIPYPLNFSVIALLRGLLYNDHNLTQLDQFFNNITLNELKNTKQCIIDQGINAEYNGKKIINIVMWLLQLASNGLDADDQAYLIPLNDLLLQLKTPSQITKDRLQIGMDLTEALSWCIVTNHETKTRGERNECRNNNSRVYQYN